MAVLFAADDRAAKATSKPVDWTNPRAAFVWSLRTVAPGTGLRRRIEVLKGISDEGEVTRKFMEARCDRGADSQSRRALGRARDARRARW
jgi:hypothetical protein